MNWHTIAGIVLMAYTSYAYADERSISNLLCELREARWLQEEPSVWDTIHRSAVSDRLVELGRSDQSVGRHLTREFAECFTLFADSNAAVQYAYRLQRTMVLIDPCLVSLAVSNVIVDALWPVERYGELLWILQSTRRQEVTRTRLSEFDAFCKDVYVHCATAGTAIVQARALAYLIQTDPVTGLPGVDSQRGMQLSISALNRATSIDDQVPIVSVLSANEETRHLAAKWLRHTLEDATLHPSTKVALCEMLAAHAIVSTQDLHAVRSAWQHERDAAVQRSQDNN